MVGNTRKHSEPLGSARKLWGRVKYCKLVRTRGATGSGGRTDLKLENKYQCIRYKRDGGTTIEPESTKDTVGDQGFGAGCKREYVRVLRLIGKVKEPKYEYRQRISAYKIRKRCAAREGYKESVYRKGLEIGPFQKRGSDYRERLKVVDVRDDCCNWPWQAGV